MDPAIMRLTRQMVAARNSAEARVMERRLLHVRTRGRGWEASEALSRLQSPEESDLWVTQRAVMCEPETRRLGVQLKGARVCGRQSRGGGWEEPQRSILGGEDAG